MEDYIKHRWKSRNGFRFKAEMWNERAAGFESIPIPTREDNEFIRLLTDEYNITSDTTVLDIGCGAGQYSIAIAKMAKRVVALDFSEKMLELARTSAEKNGVTNIEFVQCDWSDLSADDPLIRNGFDLVIAHMTPAIGSAPAFEKMIGVAKEMCFYSLPVRREKELTNMIYNKLDRGERLTDDNNIIYAYGLAWHKGLYPQIHYREGRKRKDGIPSEDLVENIIQELSDQGPTTDGEKSVVKEIVESLADDDGYVRIPSHVKIATLYWTVN